MCVVRWRRLDAQARSGNSGVERPNRCKKLTKRRMFARGALAPLEQSTLDGGTPLAWPFYNTAQAACRALRRRVKPFCNLCDSRSADVHNRSAMRNAMQPNRAVFARHVG